MEELPKTRAEARSLGLPRYFTGLPCKWGHVVWRYVAGGCSTCSIERSSASQMLNVEDRNARRRARYAEDLAVSRAVHAAYRAANREAIRAKGARYVKRATGAYVKRAITRDTPVSRDSIPDSLVQVKRLHILIKRQLKEST